MLFDLRGRGRRRTVQVIYLGLAFIFLIGFVGLGVGVGGGGGGILNAITGNESSGGGPNYASKISVEETRTKRKPSDAAAWLKLAETQLLQAGQSEYYEQTTGAGKFTAKGKELLLRLERSWNKYLQLNPPHPNLLLAQRMTSIFGEEGLNKPSQAVEAMQIVIADKPPSAALYGELAEFAYKAHNTRQGDLASEKAVSLSPKGERKRVKEQLAAIKLNPSGTANGTSGSTYTTTYGGKTYTGKTGPNGTLNASPVTTPTNKSSTSSSKSSSSNPKKK
jgi:hypothetical protein